MKKLTLITIAALFTLNVWGQTQIETSPIWYNGNNVGIGITSPGYSLDVSGQGQFINNGDNLRLKGIAAGNAAITYLRFFDTDNVALGYLGYPSSSNNDIYLASYTDNIRFNTGGSTRMIVNSNGNVGIGITDPGYKLDIQALGVTANINLLRLYADAYATGQSVAELTFIAEPNLINIEGGTNDAIAFSTYGEERLRILSNGNVGIGTSNPTHKLDVYGDTKIENSLTYSTTLYGHIIGFSRDGANYIWAESANGYLLFGVNGGSKGIDYSALHIDASKTARFYGDVGIGTSNIAIPSGYKLAVDGKAIFEEVKVEISDNWSDFVFEPGYELMSLKELETFIQENKHLPEIPTTTEVEENGISVGEMNAKLLQKIEELTLYTIQQQEVIQNLLQRVEQLENK